MAAGARDSHRILFIHGQRGGGSGVKAEVIRRALPELIVPDFTGGLAQRMAALAALIGDQAPWTLIGSSMGGLMAALIAGQRPAQIRRLILLAPALAPQHARAAQPLPATVPVIIYHGRRDNIFPPQPVAQVARELFANLTFHLVDDDHRLHGAVRALDWPRLVDGSG